LAHAAGMPATHNLLYHEAYDLINDESN